MGIVTMVIEMTNRRRRELKRLMQSADLAVNDQIVVALAKPPEERRVLLEQLRASGCPRVLQLLKVVEEQIADAMENGCSMSLIDNLKFSGRPYASPGMKRAWHGVRVGDGLGAKLTRRLTPAQSVGAGAATEDRYDGMTTFEAMICRDPPSISGLQIQRLRELRGRETKLRDRNNPRSRAKNADRPQNAGSGKS